MDSLNRASEIPFVKRSVSSRESSPAESNSPGARMKRGPPPGLLCALSASLGLVGLPASSRLSCAINSCVPPVP
eukprot:scaffold304613_cov33-Tisochrysis_lutea.AAC.1